MLNPLTALIVDDEKESRDSLRHFITKYCEGVTVKGEAQNIKEAMELIARYEPDVVFLDVEMPFGNAFDLLEQLDTIRFETIFVTAYSQYAMQALNMSASYYLLKPIDIDELVASVDRIREKQSEKNKLQNARVLIDNFQVENKQLHKVVLPVLDGFEVVRVKDVIHCKANDNFTEFYLEGGKKKMICRPLKFYEELLEPYDFLRVHKSHLVNLQYVTKYHKGKGGRLTMSNGNEVDVAPARKQSLLNRF
ncbi:response regulator transcription factor [bacterium SCSIO 12741]|nr:response regulator transcription factor [bacterium SCSIO 12741]